MDYFVIILIFVLLIFIGVYFSVRLYTRGALGRGPFKRIRRVRTIRPTPGGPVVEETVEEEIEEAAPNEEEV